MIYIIKTLGRECYKIGKSKNIKQRLGAICCGNPDFIIIVCAYETDNDKKYEDNLHEYYKNNNKKLEWFIFNDKEIVDVKEHIKNNYPNMKKIYDIKD